MHKKIIVALDEINISSFRSIVDSLDNEICIIKIGSVAFNSIGHEAISYVYKKGFEIFLDLKFHDIPNTVFKSIEGLASLPIKMLTIHTSGGKDMMGAAMRAVAKTNIKIFGVTTLTSLNNEDTNQIYKRNVTEQVNAMLDLAEEAEINGVVCSPHEIELVAKRQSLLSIVPGIRLDDTNDDQKRVLTPKQAIDLGADFIVIGRPITTSNNVSKTLNEILLSIQ